MNRHTYDVMHDPELFSFAQREKYRGLEDASEIISGEMLGNTDRMILRRLAEPGQTLALLQEGFLAYVQTLMYAIPPLDLRKLEDFKRALELQAEIRAV